MVFENYCIACFERDYGTDAVFGCYCLMSKMSLEDEKAVVDVIGTYWLAGFVAGA